MAKQELTSEQIYKKNQKLSKLFRILSPICFWGFLALSIICLYFALVNSFGNIAEICNLLDNKQFTGDELRENYNYLTDKYGEWIIGSGSAGFTITFVNIGNALFSGLMITSCVFAVIFFASAYILGKWILPKLSAQILIDNQDMVNMVVLRNNEGVKKE